ncbi:hypothetical protein Ahia01_001414200 [Argonauta hians]
MANAGSVAALQPPHHQFYREVQRHQQPRQPWSRRPEAGDVRHRFCESNTDTSWHRHDSARQASAVLPGQPGSKGGGVAVGGRPAGKLADVRPGHAGAHRVVVAAGCTQRRPEQVPPSCLHALLHRPLRHEAGARGDGQRSQDTPHHARLLLPRGVFDCTDCDCVDGGDGFFRCNCTVTGSCDCDAFCTGCQRARRSSLFPRGHLCAWPLCAWALVWALVWARRVGFCAERCRHASGRLCSGPRAGHLLQPTRVPRVVSPRVAARARQEAQAPLPATQSASLRVGRHGRHGATLPTPPAPARPRAATRHEPPAATSTPLLRRWWWW